MLWYVPLDFCITCNSYFWPLCLPIKVAWKTMIRSISHLSYSLFYSWLPFIVYRGMFIKPKFPEMPNCFQDFFVQFPRKVVKISWCFTSWLPSSHQIESRVMRCIILFGRCVISEHIIAKWWIELNLLMMLLFSFLLK